MSTPAEKECEKQMKKAVEYLKNEVRGIRTGRASPALVEHLKIEVSAYGSQMELRELASIGVPEASTLLVKPFDPGTLKDIERGIIASNIGITPQSDGKSIRLPVPALSGERRQQLVTQVKKAGEAQKISIRNARRDGNKAIDQAEKDKQLTEDSAKDARERIQKMTTQYEAEIDAVIKTKSAEIEEI